MKKISIIVLAVILTAAFAATVSAATYEGWFYYNYTTTESVTIPANGHIDMYNNVAQYFDGSYLNGACFKTEALRNGSAYKSLQTYAGTDYTFDWIGSTGIGKLRFINDYSPWKNMYQLHNQGTFTN